MKKNRIKKKSIMKIKDIMKKKRHHVKKRHHGKKRLAPHDLYKVVTAQVRSSQIKKVKNNIS